MLMFLLIRFHLTLARLMLSVVGRSTWSWVASARSLQLARLLGRRAQESLVGNLIRYGVVVLPFLQFRSVSRSGGPNTRVRGAFLVGCEFI